MIYSLDFQFYEENKLPLSPNNRAFQYGDGLFETIIRTGRQIHFLDWHFERLSAGIHALGMQAGDLERSRLKQTIEELCQMQGLTDARIKIQVWRHSGGLYTPTNNRIHLLISAQPFHAPASLIKRKVGISQNVRLAHTSFSAFKTCNALPYILAGQERTMRQLDDLVLLDQQGHVSECTSANIFWLKNNQWFTPSLATGCISGIMRRFFIDYLADVREITAPIQDIMEADAAFACNVTGVYPIQQLEQHTYQTAKCPESPF